MAKKATSKINVKDFFGGLYEQPEVLPKGEYDEKVTGLIVRTMGNTMVGDQALQSLLTHYVMKNAESLDDFKSMSVVVAGIKQVAIKSIAKRFPSANLEELIGSARDAGFDVKVLGKV